MALENILSQEIVQKLGWTLLHFVWQAAAVALLLTILLALLRKSTANLRYIVACAALGLIVLLPMVTIKLVPVSTPQPIAGIEPPPAPVIVQMQPTTEETSQASVVEHEETVQPESVSPAPAAPWKQRAVDRLEPTLPYLVSGWLIGVFGLSLWHLGGWAQLQRLRKKLIKQVDAPLRATLNRLSQRMGVKRAVQLVESALVQVPTVIGWLRPVILLPASALTGLNAEQLEALLAHELAHIRRYDYLVNMLQTVVETLGFYHPAVWWVSHKIRIERENCCDDLAVSIYGDRVRYARALTSMEEIRGRCGELAVAATGGNLFGRIRRLIDKEPTNSSRTSWIPSLITILLIAIIAIPSTLALTANDKTPHSAKFLLDKMLEHRSRVKNLQYEAEDNLWRDVAAEEVLIENQIKSMRESGISERQLEQLKKSLSEVPESRYQILKCTVDDEEHVKIEQTGGNYDSSGRKMPRDDKHIWAWNGVLATDFSQRSGLPASANIRNTPRVATKLGHPWRSFTGIFCGYLEETIAAEIPVSVEKLEDNTYRIAFDYKTSKYAAIVDPSKGYTCSLQETYNEKGQLNSRTTATYEEVAEGTWFPVSGQRQEYTPEGAVRYRSIAKLSQIRINDPAFNAGYFDVDMPEGTAVRDEVQGKKYVVGSKRVYDLDERRKPSAEIEEVDPNSWQEKFYSIYRLEDGQVLKRIAPPFIPERTGYLKSIQPGRYSPNTPLHLVNQYFNWEDKLSIRGARLGSGIPRLITILGSVIGLGNREYDIPTEILSSDMSGDWIVRKDTPQEELLQALEQIVKDETSRDIDFVKQNVETDVIIVKGKYNFQLLPNITDGQYVLISTNNTDTYSGGGGGSGTLGKFLRWVGNRVGMNIVDETEAEGVELSWHNHDSSELSRLNHNAEPYNQRLDSLLKNLARQTGLKFERETATVEKWVITEKGIIKNPQKADAPIGNYEESIGSNQVVLKLIDPNSQPVVGACVGTYVDWSDIAENPPIWFLREGRSYRTVDVESDEYGKVTLEAEELFGSGWTPEGKAPFTAIDEGHYLTGLREMSREDLGSEVTLMLQPGCRVRGRVSASTARKRRWSIKTLTVYVDWQQHRPCQYSSKQGRFEFVLPPGKYEVMVYAEDPEKAVKLPILIKPGQRDLDMTKYLDGTSLPPAVETKNLVESNEGRIEGRIIDINTGKGIAAVQLAAVPNSSPTLSDRFSCTSGQDGTFAIGGLQSGEYLLRGDFPSVDVDVVSGRSTNDVLIGVRRQETVLAPKETTAEQQSDGQIMIGTRVIEMPTDVMKDVFEPNESLSSGLLVRNGHEIAGRLLALRQEREDVKQLINPQIEMINNSNATILTTEEMVYTSGYEPNDSKPGNLTAQHKTLKGGWKYNIKAEILDSGEKVHMEFASRQQKLVFETLQYRPGYDYQIPIRPEIFATEVTAKNGEPVVIGRLRHNETAFCLIVTPSVILPERQPEPLLGKKLPEPDNIQNIDDLKQTEGKPTLICFWDMNQRPSRNLIGDLAKRENELAEKNVAVYLVHTSKIEPAKLKQWLDNRNIPFACGSIKNDAEKVLFRWGVPAQPWLILTDEEGVVRAEGFNIEQLDEKLQANGTNDVLSRAEGANFVGNSTPGESSDMPQEKTDAQREAEVFGRVLQDGRNVVGARVIARIRRDQPSKLSSRPTALVTRTDENGLYRFADLPAGRYSISVMSQKGNLNMAQKQINLEPGDRNELNFGDEEGFTLTGVVTVDREAVEIASVMIQLPNESVKWGWTDRNGNFRITGIPSGRYRLFTTYDKDLDPVTFIWGKDGKQDYDTRFDRRQITIENDRSVDIRLEDRSKKENPAGTSKITADKACIVKVDLSVVEVFSDSKMDRETIIAVENLLGGKITLPDSPAVADLLRKAAGATAAVKDESAGDKRVTQEQFKTLFDLLVTRGYVNILMNPTLEVVDGGTAQIRSKQKIPSIQDSLEDSIQITPTVRKNGNIILQTNLDLYLKSAEPDANQPPSIRHLNISTGANISPGESWIVEGMKDAEKNAGTQEQKSELLVILTPTIVAYVEPKEPMETVNFENVGAGTVIEKLAEWTGKTIIPTAELMKQKITIYAPEKMPRSKAVAIIYNSLHSKGYIAEQTDETIFLKPMPEERPGTDKSQILIDTKILTVSDEFLKDIGLDPNSLASSKGWSNYLVHTSDDSASFVIDQLHEDLLLRTVAARMRTHKDIQMLDKPQVLAASGKKCEIHITESEYYMLTSPSEPNALTGESESKSKRIELGTTVRLTPNLTPDGKKVDLDFELERRQLRGFKEHTGTEKQTQKIPIVDVYSIKTPCTVPDGKTLLIASKKIPEQKKKEPGTPGLAGLPLIGPLFSSPAQVEETRYLLIMVKPSINPHIKAPPTLQPLDPNDPLIKKLEEKFKRSDEQK